MSWVTLTIDDVKRRLSATEYDAISTAALADDQVADDVVEDTARDIVRTVRGYVAACPKNSLGEGDTIPDELLGDALAILRWNILTRLPDVGLATEQREKEYDTALQRMRDVAACRFTIVQPETVTDEVVATPQIEASSSPRQATREKMKGL